MDKLSPQVREAVGQMYPAYIATVRDDGWPSVAPQGFHEDPR